MSDDRLRRACPAPFPVRPDWTDDGPTGTRATYGCLAGRRHFQSGGALPKHESTREEITGRAGHARPVLGARNHRPRRRPSRQSFKYLDGLTRTNDRGRVWIEAIVIDSSHSFLARLWHVDEGPQQKHPGHGIDVRSHAPVNGRSVIAPYPKASAHESILS